MSAKLVDRFDVAARHFARRGTYCTVEERQEIDREYADARAALVAALDGVPPAPPAPPARDERLDRECRRCRGAGEVNGGVRGHSERCGECDGYGRVPTEFGEAVLAFVLARVRLAVREE